VGRSADVESLFQLPLEEFTAARNALAKTSGDASIRELAKPAVAAWAVNQLYWRDRRTWDALVDAAQNLRRTHTAVLSGMSGDVRAAGSAHDEAVHDALKSTLRLLDEAGHPATDAVRQSVLNTLRALPADEPPGRLTRALQPGGFEMLAGLSVGGPARKETEGTKGDRRQPKEATKGDRGQTKEVTKAGSKTASKTASKDAKALTRAREAAAAADRAVREAEQAVRRHEFEIARAARDGERAAKAVERARAALEEARTAVTAAEREHTDAARRHKTATDAAKKAEAAVAAARDEAESAHAALKQL
jgi:hypothetical protein